MSYFGHLRRRRLRLRLRLRLPFQSRSWYTRRIDKLASFSSTFHFLCSLDLLSPIILLVPRQIRSNSLISFISQDNGHITHDPNPCWLQHVDKFLPHL